MSTRKLLLLQLFILLRTIVGPFCLCSQEDGSLFCTLRQGQELGQGFLFEFCPVGPAVGAGVEEEV